MFKPSSSLPWRCPSVCLSVCLCADCLAAGMVSTDFYIYTDILGCKLNPLFSVRTGLHISLTVTASFRRTSALPHKPYWVPVREFTVPLLRVTSLCLCALGCVSMLVCVCVCVCSYRRVCRHVVPMVKGGAHSMSSQWRC